LALFSRKDSTPPAEAPPSWSERGRAARESGYRAEDLAAEFLADQAVTILARNVRCKGGEIDIVGQHDGTVIFVEVRLRSKGTFGLAAESITVVKQRRIALAAQTHLQRNPRLAALPCRFDCVVMNDEQKPEWIRDAFRLD